MTPADPTPEADVPPGAAPIRRHSTVDVVATALLGVLTVLIGCASLCLSLLFAMAADACTSTPCGGDGVIGLAYLITWGGVAAAVVLAAAGCAKAQRRGDRMWPWPAASIALIVVTFIAGLLLANSLFHH